MNIACDACARYALLRVSEPNFPSHLYNTIHVLPPLARIPRSTVAEIGNASMLRHDTSSESTVHKRGGSEPRSPVGLLQCQLARIACRVYQVQHRLGDGCRRRALLGILGKKRGSASVLCTCRRSAQLTFSISYLHDRRRPRLTISRMFW